MEKRVELNLLLDFYGALLTEHKREILRLYVEEDMSLQEIADSFGISRQGVHDSVNKSRQQLMEYEEKLGLLQRFKELKNRVGECEIQLAEAKRSLEKAEALIRSLNDM